jgi:hypothetical protein
MAMIMWVVASTETTMGMDPGMDPAMDTGGSRAAAMARLDLATDRMVIKMNSTGTNLAGTATAGTVVAMTTDQIGGDAMIAGIR